MRGYTVNKVDKFFAFIEFVFYRETDNKII